MIKFLPTLHTTSLIILAFLGKLLSCANPRTIILNLVVGIISLPTTATSSPFLCPSPYPWQVCSCCVGVGALHDDHDVAPSQWSWTSRTGQFVGFIHLFSTLKKIEGIFLHLMYTARFTTAKHLLQHQYPVSSIAAQWVPFAIDLHFPNRLCNCLLPVLWRRFGLFLVRLKTWKTTPLLSCYVFHFFRTFLWFFFFQRLLQIIVLLWRSVVGVLPFPAFSFGYRTPTLLSTVAVSAETLLAFLKNLISFFDGK